MSAMILFRFFEERSEDELKQESEAIASGTDEYGIGYLTRLKSERRITLIDTDGTVLYDNEADPAEMENHKDRTEVKEAFSNGSGTSIRYSNTMTEETIYYALKLKDGQVLRIAATQDSIYAWLIKLLIPAGCIFGIAVCGSLIISSKLSRSILTPINNLNLDDPENNDTYEELHPLLERISTQNKMIRSQEREESEKREKFRREFTANVSHELKTPLTSISGFAELMKQGGMDEETVIDFSTTIYDESQRLITLVNDIIRLSSLEDRDIQYEWENVNLLGLSRDVASRLQSAADRKRVKILVIGREQNVYGIWDLIYEMVATTRSSTIRRTAQSQLQWAAMKRRRASASRTRESVSRRRISTGSSSGFIASTRATRRQSAGQASVFRSSSTARLFITRISTCTAHWDRGRKSCLSSRRSRMSRDSAHRRLTHNSLV